MIKKTTYLILTLITSTVILSCEKEIEISIPASQSQYVVEASINTRFPFLNYVFITNTVDYFKPDLSLNGVKNALVFITPGIIFGSDTIFNDTDRIQLIAIDTLAKLIPALDSLIGSFSGVYMNPILLQGKENTPYRLDITLMDGTKILGRTTIPKIVPIDSFSYRKEKVINRKEIQAFLTFWITDGPEKNNYRMAVRNYTDSILYGWGAADFYRTFDDELLNNGVRPFMFSNSWDEGDTVNIYFSQIGRKEFFFWQSFGQAANNGGPFATPGSVKSNITSHPSNSVIGSFTGYALDFKQIILK